MDFLVIGVLSWSRLLCFAGWFASGIVDCFARLLGNEDQVLETDRQQLQLGLARLYHVVDVIERFLDCFTAAECAMVGQEQHF
uniref:Putative secreted protein n=1 Tax=Anopheles triannulatus TaxID=58253 RepID=A0A2M4B2T9_9DIPT